MLSEVSAMILATLSAGGVLVASLTYLCKSIITHWLDKDIERFKQTLLSDSDKEMALFRVKLQEDSQRQIEEFKAKLESQRARMQISYGGIFVKQAEAILEIDVLLFKLQEAGFNFCDDPKNADYRSEFANRFWEARMMLEKYSILMPNSIVDTIRSFINTSHMRPRDIARLERSLSNIQKLGNDIKFEELHKKLDDANSELFEKLPQIRELIKNEFRLLLNTN